MGEVRLVDDQYELARAIMTALFPSVRPKGLDDAIRMELLVDALQDVRRPRTLSDLLIVLERLAEGEVAELLVCRVHECAAPEPDVLLSEFVGRAA